MNRRLIGLLLFLPVASWSQPANAGERPASTTEGEPAEEREEDSVTWMDSGHAYATDQAQALTEWMDGFFGDPVYDIEKPESLLRLEWEHEWDEQDDHRSRGRLRGKIRLPALSDRLNLVFSGEDGDSLAADDRVTDEGVGLLYNVRERKRSRVDLTMGLDWGELAPGIRYRNQGPISERLRYRYTQRLEWESDDGWRTTGQVNLDRALTESRLLRWSNEAEYGEETDGVQWRSRLSLRQRFETRKRHDPFVLAGFATVRGATDPGFVRNYRVGAQLRSQFLRRYLFFEVEPSYNFRKREGESREGVWNIQVRLELLFEPERRRTREILARERAEDEQLADGNCPSSTAC